MPIINVKKTLCYLLILLLLPVAPSVYALGYESSPSVFRFQKKMAEKGRPEAQYNLAMMYETGSGVEQNLQAARVWYGRASFQNYAPARNRLTYLDIRQNGFKEHHKEWLKELKKEADFNNGESLFLLGQMHAEGIGVQKSLTKSLTLLRKAAAGNIPGSEAEITRIEKELQDLQQKYRQQETEQKQRQLEAQRLQKEKQKKQQDLTAARKRQEQEARRTHLAEQAKLRQQRREQEQKRKAAEKARLEQQRTETRIKAALEKQLEESKKKQAEEDSDGPCSGRNRFSPTCR